MPAKKVSLDNTNAKPSLASLKPTSGKSSAAKKRAVKKIDAASAKKVPTTKARTAAIKKIATKRVSGAQEQSVTIARSLPSKSTVSNNRKEKEINKSNLKRKATPQKNVPVTSEFSVRLPNNMSIRAREKALVILHYLQQDLRVPAQRAAYIGGLTFVVFGSLFSLSFALVGPNSALQSATLASTTGTTGDTVGETTNTLATVIRPVFSSNDDLPAILTSDLTFTFTVENGRNVSARLYSFSDGRKISLNTEMVYTNTYRTQLRFHDLAAGEYKLELIAESIQDGSKTFYNAGSFTIEHTIATATSGSGDTAASGEDETTANTTDTSGDATGEALTESNSANLEEIATTTATAEIAPTETETFVTKPQLAITDTDFSKQEVIKVYAPTNTRVVEMYIRPLKSVQSRFLGSAVQGKASWYYFFDTLQVPNGEYEVYARTRSDAATFLTSDSKRIKVSNVVATTAVTEPIKEESEVDAPETATEADDETDEKEEEEETTVETTMTTRSFSDISTDEFSDTGSTTEAVPAVEEEVRDVLTDYREELTELLRRYSVAQQSGDSVLIDIARKELFESKQKLIIEILNDDAVNHLADDVDTVLTERFESLQKRVETFEQLRRSANSDSTAIDTDRDGVSDFDEQNLYRTSPEQADTDSDGVTDGIEIMRGYDPLNGEAEAIINYEMPQETIALVQEETLKIDAVVPILQTDSLGNGNLPVFAEIRGKALPNSFVTIYVFSTPTIVTVRTDNDGSFVYTFDKELEDGAHEVYVAVTDNTGAIMARSNPFRFIKEAQAFTPVDATGVEVVSSQSLAEFTTMNSYNIAVGIGILAFGIILLMLGMSLREKDPLVMTKPEHDLKTS